MPDGGKLWCAISVNKVRLRSVMRLMNLLLSSNDLLSMQAADVGISLSERDRTGNRILEIDTLNKNYTVIIYRE